ncbi:MAG: hypothetical protein ACLR23_10970 [Clostridia bacterium]
MKCAQTIMKQCGFDRFDVGLYSINDSFMVQLMTVLEMGLDSDRVNGMEVLVWDTRIGATGLSMYVTFYECSADR